MNKIASIIFSSLLLLSCGGKTEPESDGTDYAWESEYAGANAFGERVLNDTATFSQDISSEAESVNVKIVESTDGRIKVYSWICGGGSSPDWGNVTQFRDASGRVRCVKGLPLSDYNYGCTVTDILTAENIDGQTVYFLEYYTKASSNDGTSGVVTAVMRGDKFVPGPKFKHNGEIMERVSANYTISSWYFKTNNGEGWDWLFSYQQDEKLLYVPLTDDMELTNRYAAYRYDGKYFTYVGEKAPRNLHPSLHEFKNLIYYSETERHLVRVDALSNGKYRLALWSNPAKARMWHEPALVLSNGRYNDVDGRFEFPLAGGTKYEFVTGPDAELLLTNDGRIIDKEEERISQGYYITAFERLFPQMNDTMHGYAQPMLVYLTDNYVVRVDSMPDGKYRYASWKRSSYPYKIPQPDITITDNCRTDEGYVFHNKKYCYLVPHNTADYVYVYKGDTTLLKDNIVRTYDTDDIARLGTKEDDD